MRICQTPEAVYNFHFTPSKIGAAVDLPFNLDLTEDQAKQLEDELHDALEAVLKQFF